jgi:hypothetical protein
MRGSATVTAAGLDGRHAGRALAVVTCALLAALPAGALASDAAPTAPGIRILASGPVHLAPDGQLEALPAAPAHGVKAAPEGLPPYTLYPQAGRLGQDLFLYNGTDLDATTAIRDWECTAYTYDGHQGHDLLTAPSARWRSACRSSPSSTAW